MRHLASLPLLLLAGCQTGEQYQAQLDADRAARMRALVGRTVADFSRASQLVPSNFYDTRDGRVFMVEGPSTALALAPAYGSPGVVRTFTCRITLTAVNPTKGNTADDWRITDAQSTGPC